MPLYTYVMCYRSETRVEQHSSSNYTGFLSTPIMNAFPELKPHLRELMVMRPKPIPNAKKTWSSFKEIKSERFDLVVVETRP